MEKSENIELKRILDILKSKVLLIVLILMCSTILGYVYSYYYVVPQYKSKATLLLIPNETSENKAITTTDLSLNSELISTYSNIAKQPKILKQVINNLSLNMTEQELLNNMQVKIVSSTYIIELSVTNASPQMARTITKELSDVFLNEIKQIYNLNNIGIIDEANFSNEAYNVNHIKDMAMFLAGGIAVSVVAIIAIYIFDNTIKAEEDIERYIKIKTLGKIPLNNQKNEIINRNDVKSYVTECINTIRTNILYMNAVKGSKAILITSCTPREGKSWVSTNISVAFAETNKKVLLIDCDMRKGRIHKIFNASNEEGLSNYLYEMSGDVKKDIKLAKKYIQETTIPNLHILTNGSVPPNPSELIDSDSMKELIALAKTIYDVVIIDAPPCKLVTDSIILSRIVDSTILIAKSEKTKINDLKEVKKSIEIVNGKIIGGIVNQVKMTQKAYGNTYYYGHKTKENECEVKEKPIVSVDEVINEAMKKLKNKKSSIILQEENTKEEIRTDNEVIKNKETIVVNEQTNNHLEEVINTLSDIKIQLKNSMIENKLNDKEKSEKLEELISEKIEELSNKNANTIKEELQNINITEELNKIVTELENVKSNFQITKDDIEYTIKKGMLTKEEIEDIVKNEIVSKEAIQDIVKNEIVSKEAIQDIVKSEMVSEEAIQDIVKNSVVSKSEIDTNFNTIYSYIEHMKQNLLTKEQVAEVINTVEQNKPLKETLSKEEMQEIITSNMLTKEAVENIINEDKLTKQDVQEIITSNMLTKEAVENIINEDKLTKQDVQDIITTEMITKESIEEIVNSGRLTKEMMKQELENINYKEQINEINEKMASLQENYLELLNIIKTKQLEIEEPNGENIVHIKSFKKQAEKKKRVYSIKEEMIPYEELEKTAFRVIHLKQNNAQTESYEDLAQ